MGCCQSKNRVSDVDQTVVYETEPSNRRPVRIDTQSNKNISDHKPEVRQVDTTDEISQVKEWKTLLEQLKNNKQINTYALSKKREQFSNLDELIQFIKNSPAKNTIEKAYVIFLWTTHNISYDVVSFKTGKFKSQDAESVFINGMGVCEGYATLFKEICDRVGIECIKIVGYAKGIGYNIGDKMDKTNHAWNAIKVETKWYFVESTWGSGAVDGQMQFIRMYNPYYFLTPAHAFIYTHYNEEHQYLKNKITLSDFEKLPFLNVRYHLFGLNVINSQVITDSKNPIFIEYSAPKETILLVTLFNEDFTDIQNSSIMQRDSKTHKYGISMFLPQKNKKYYFRMFAKENKNDELTHIATYIINRTGDQTNLSFPPYQLEYDYGIKCLSHNSQIISTDKSPLFLEFSTAKDTELINSLLEENGQTIQNSTLSQRDAKSDRYGMFFMLPDKISKYKINIFAKNSSEPNSKYLTQFLIFKTGNQMNYELPNYAIEHKNGIKLLSHSSQLIYADKNVIDLEFFLPDNSSLTGAIKDPNKNNIDNMVLVQNKFESNNLVEMKLSIPFKFDKCFLDLFGGKTGENQYLSTYTILNINTNRAKVDKQFIFAFNKEKIKFYVLSPIEKNLEFRKEYEFKVYIKNCETIALVVESKWNYLVQEPSDENLWSAKINLDKKGAINLFAKLKANSNFDCLCAYEVV